MNNSSSIISFVRFNGKQYFAIFWGYAIHCTKLISSEMDVSCEFKFVDWRENPNLYSCVVTEIAINKPGIKISRFVGEHLSEMTDKDVSAVIFSI